MPRPFILEMNPGDRKALCTCEGSANMPFCDGNHRGTGQTPFVITFTKDNKVTVTGSVCGSTLSQENEGIRSPSGGGCCRSKAPKPQIDENEEEGHGHHHGHGGCGCKH
ncbi:MAG: Iron-binding zinc finger type [Chlamydiales bacterium]|jgi:hypothetical protein|nr:Iron-binding zinc finger type [Chlamydiales bacterium]